MGNLLKNVWHGDTILSIVDTEPLGCIQDIELVLVQPGRGRGTLYHRGSSPGTNQVIHWCNFWVSAYRKYQLVQCTSGYVGR